MLQVEAVLGVLAPGQLQQQLHVVVLHAELGTCRVHALELLQLALEGLAHLLRPPLLRGLRAHLLDLLLDGVAAQLVLDGLHLLVQEVLALLAVHLGAHLALDLVLHLQQLKLLGQVRQQQVGPLAEVGHLQHALLLGHLGVHVAADEVDQERGRVDVLDRELGLGGDVRALLDDLQREVLQRAHQRVELLVVLVRAQFVELLDAGGEIGLLPHHLGDLEALPALDDGRGAAVRHAQHADDGGQRAHPVQVLRTRLLDVAVLLAHHAQRLVAPVHLLDQADAAVATHGDGDDHPREEHGVAQRQDGQFRRRRLRVHLLLVLRRDQRDELRLVLQCLRAEEGVAFKKVVHQGNVRLSVHKGIRGAIRVRDGFSTTGTPPAQGPCRAHGADTWAAGPVKAARPRPRGWCAEWPRRLR